MAIYQSEMRKSAFGDSSTGAAPSGNFSNLLGELAVTKRSPSFLPQKLRVTSDSYTSPSGRTESALDSVNLFPTNFGNDFLICFANQKADSVGSVAITLLNKEFSSRPAQAFSFSTNGTDGSTQAEQFLYPDENENRSFLYSLLSGNISDNGSYTISIFYKDN
jgi:hypothetical protein